MANTKNIMFLTNEDDDGYGYMCSISPLEYIYVNFWAKDTKTVPTIYLSKKDMYDRAKQFGKSGLTSYSQNHIAQHKMYQAYIEWYENQ